jgi:N-acetylglucosamine-6-phosphate deacetylase
VLSPGTVEIDDGVITAVHGRAVKPADVTLAPGFVDIQVNGIGDIDVATADGSDWDELGRRLLAQGVTAWCPTLVTQPMEQYGPALGRIASARQQQGPAILGAHLEGPFLGGAPGAHNPKWLQPIDLAWIASLPSVVALMTLAPELDQAANAIAKLRAANTVVSLGHSTATYEEATAGATSGATLVTHCFNGMGPLHHRAPGLLGAALTDDRLTVSVIADLVHVHPAAIKLAFRAKGPSNVILVTDAVANVTITDGAPRLPNGTLAGSCLTMDRAIANVVDHAGVSLEDAIRAATANPANLMGHAALGRIQPGARADLVVLDEDLRPTATYIAGEQVFERQ